MSEPATAVSQDSVKANWTNKTIEVTGQLIWNVLTVVGIALMLYGGWQHAEAAKENNKSVVEAIKESNQTELYT